MKVDIFMPKYMENFKCISSNCKDTCCAGWDINIDENTFNKYSQSTGELKELLAGKFRRNTEKHEFFNHGFMVLKDSNRCPFLGADMLCDIHGSFGEENLCITCKSYPRVFNIVDGVYEKSGIPSCEEICLRAFLCEEKMEFIERKEVIDEENIEIRRIVDSEAFGGTDNLLQYFWDIRIISINLIQNRRFSIEERLNLLEGFYKEIENTINTIGFDYLDEVIEDFSKDDIDYESLKGKGFTEEAQFYKSLCSAELINNVKGFRLRECIKEYRSGIKNHSSFSVFQLEKFDYIFENYLVNQIFKDLIPFNKGGILLDSYNLLKNTYKIIKTYVIGIAMNFNRDIQPKDIIRVIQALSKEIEHNKVYKNLLEK